MVKVLTGEYKGRVLVVPEVARPLTARIKKSLFDILGERIINARILDLFAGSGSFSIEALSRGADFCVLVEKNRFASKIISKNLKNLSENEFYRIITEDIKIALKKLLFERNMFDIIFFDPPFEWKWDMCIIDMVVKLMKDKSSLIIRYMAKDKIKLNSEQIKCVREKKYGDSIVKFYNKQ